MKRVFLSLCLATSLLVSIPVAGQAQVFNGPGLQGGVNQAQQIEGPAKGDLREVVTNFLLKVLNFLALFATIVIIVAGIYLIAGFGSDDAKNKAKTIILYTIIGLIVILLARLAAGYLTKGLSDNLT